MLSCLGVASNITKKLFQVHVVIHCWLSCFSRSFKAFPSKHSMLLFNKPVDSKFSPAIFAFLKPQLVIVSLQLQEPSSLLIKVYVCIAERLLKQGAA